METFRDLKVWRSAHHLVLEIYRVTKIFPRDEQYALVQQMRRAVVSIAANLAEGSKRRTIKDKTHFYNLSDTSLEEVKYYFILSKDLGYLKEHEYRLLMLNAEEVGKMLNGLMRSLQKI